MQVRRATEADIPWLLVQLREFAASYPMRRSLVGSPDDAERLLGTLIRDQFVCMAEDATGLPVGLIAGVVGPHYLNPDLRLATEVFWFVPPAHRGSRAALLLLNAFDAWAVAQGAHGVHMALEADTPTNDRFLTKRGYRKAEVHYVRDVS